MLPVTDSSPSAQVVHFPPLPPLPEPPRLATDPRQQEFHKIMLGLAQSLGEAVHMQVANTTTGYHASAVDIGRMQTTLCEAVARFDLETMKSRWGVDLRKWVVDFVFSWAQRGKSLHFDWHEGGVRLRLNTQDDLGDYDYAFDVRPGRKS